MAKQWHQLERLDHKTLKKIQQERERALKQQKEEAERKRKLIIAISICVAVGCILSIIIIIRNRLKYKAYLEERAKLLNNNVENIIGKAYFKTLGDWELLENKITFNQEYTFKTEKESYITINLQLKNQIKILPSSEVVVNPPDLHNDENIIKKQTINLINGEVNVGVSLEGKEKIIVEVEDIKVIGISGLFKVIYNKNKKWGEVVVKSGLVEVLSNKNPSQRVKVSGFYKVMFQNGELSMPSQASVIQYDWK